uniref:Uncharacterized protein n=1 Tax=Oryza rufipogon TaxID=4529 RepID=A0A0E0PHN0_ORYRU
MDDDSPEHRREREELHAYLDKVELEFEAFQEEVRREVQETGGYLQTFDEAAHADMEEFIAQAMEEWTGTGLNRVSTLNVLTFLSIHRSLCRSITVYLIVSSLCYASLFQFLQYLGDQNFSSFLKKKLF